MLRTLKIYRTAWTRFGNCPDSRLRALPQSGSGKRYRPAPFFFFQQGRVCRFSGSPRGESPACSCVAGTTAFVKRTRSQPRQRGCSQGLGYGPNKQKLRFPATPGTAVSSLCGNKGTACQVANPHQTCQLISKWQKSALQFNYIFVSEVITIVNRRNYNLVFSIILRQDSHHLIHIFLTYLTPTW